VSFEYVPSVVPRYTLYPATLLEALAVQDNPTDVAAATPVPETAMLVGEFVALLDIFTVPVTAPAAAGSNATVKVAVCEGSRTRPEDTPLVMKPAPPLVDMPEIVTLEFPLLVSVTVNELVVPLFTLPKLKLAGLAESV